MGRGYLRFIQQFLTKRLPPSKEVTLVVYLVYVISLYIVARRMPLCKGSGRTSVNLSLVRCTSFKLSQRDEKRQCTDVHFRLQLN